MKLLEQLLLDLPLNDKNLLADLVEKSARDTPKWLAILNSANSLTQQEKNEVISEIAKHGGFQSSNFDKIIQVFPR